MVGEPYSPTNWITDMSLLSSRGYSAAFNRIEGALAEFGKTLTSVQSELSAIKVEQVNQKRQISETESDWRQSLLTVQASVDSISKKLEERDKPKTSTWIAAIGVAVPLLALIVGVGVFFVQSSIAAATSPIRQQVTGLEQLTSNLHEIEAQALQSREANARALGERTDLNRRLGVVENEIAANTVYERSKFATIDANSTEVETQFKNLTAMTYYIWHVVTGHDYPIIPRESPPNNNIK